MGRRPGDPEGAWSRRLARQDPLEAAQAFLELVGDDAESGGAGVEALRALEGDGVEAVGGDREKLGRAAVEAAPGCSVRALPPLR